MLENGFGEHNIQGIGDKHIPLIHNVMNTDVVCAVSDRATDELDVLFNTDAGPRLPRRRKGVAGRGRRRARALRALVDLQRARRDQDGEAARPRTRRRRRSPWPPTAPRCTRASGPRRSQRRFGGSFGARRRRPRSSPSTSAPPAPTTCSSCTERDRNRIFNLGYYTWVEQQGTPLERVRGPPLAGVLAGAAPLPRRVGRADRRLQRPRRRADGGEHRRRLPLRRSAGPRSTSAPRRPWRCPNGHRRGPRTTCCSIVRRPGRRWPTIDDPNPFVAFGAELAWHGVRRRRRHDRRRRGARSCARWTSG